MLEGTTKPLNPKNSRVIRGPSVENLEIVKVLSSVAGLLGNVYRDKRTHTHPPTHPHTHTHAHSSICTLKKALVEIIKAIPRLMHETNTRLSMNIPCLLSNPKHLLVSPLLAPNHPNPSPARS